MAQARFIPRFASGCGSCAMHAPLSADRDVLPPNYRQKFSGSKRQACVEMNFVTVPFC